MVAQFILKDSSGPVNWHFQTFFERRLWMTCRKPREHTPIMDRDYWKHFEYIRATPIKILKECVAMLTIPDDAVQKTRSPEKHLGRRPCHCSRNFDLNPRDGRTTQRL